jgi:hypothetical protein
VAIVYHNYLVTVIDFVVVLVSLSVADTVIVCEPVLTDLFDKLYEHELTAPQFLSTLPSIDITIALMPLESLAEAATLVLPLPFSFAPLLGEVMLISGPTVSVKTVSDAAPEVLCALT